MSSSKASVALSNRHPVPQAGERVPGSSRIPARTSPAAPNSTSSLCQGLSVPPSPAAESSLPAIWWRSQLQNPTSEILGPLWCHLLQGGFPGTAAGTSFACRKPFGRAAEGRGRCQEKANPRAVAERDSVGPTASGPGVAGPSCPTSGKGCQAFRSSTARYLWAAPFGKGMTP